MTSGSIIIIAFAIIFGVAWTWLVARRRRARFKHREPVPLDVFVQKYYDGTNVPTEVVRAALERIATATDVPTELLRPSDRFDAELRPPAGWEYDDGLALLGGELRRDAAAAGLEVEVENVKTLDDYIHIVNRLSRTAR